MRIFVMLLSLMLALFHVKHVAAADINQGSWSESDGANNQAPPAGWPAGMAPSSVEPTARAMMGATKRWYDHANCSIISTGTPNAQVLTYPVTPQARVYGDTFCFAVGNGLTNTGPTTLNINGTGALAVILNSGAALSGGELVANTYITVAYDSIDYRILNGANSGNFSGNFLVHGGAIGLDNSQPLNSKNSSGIYRNLIWENGFNDIILGDSNTPGSFRFFNNGAQHAAIDGNGSIYSFGGDFHANNNHGIFIQDTSAGDHPVFYVDGSNNLQIGNAASIGVIGFSNGGRSNAQLTAAGNLNIFGQYQVQGSQISCSNLSNAAASCSTNTTNASNITSGTLSGSLVGSGVSASNVTTGTLTGSLVGSGVNAANLSSGTVPSARLSGGYSIGNLVVSNTFGGGGGNIGLDNGNAIFMKSTGGAFINTLFVDGSNITQVGSTLLAATSVSANSGSCTFAGSGWSCVSDARLKIAQPFDDSSGVMALKPISYRFKADPNDQKHLGFAAQDVEKVYPELVSEHNGQLSLEYTGLIAPLVAKVQQLSKRVDELEAELKANKR